MICSEPEAFDSLEAEIIFLHDVATDNGSTARYASIAVNKNLAASSKAFIKEASDFLEVLDNIFCHLVSNVED